MADSAPLQKLHGLATAPRPNISAANFVFLLRFTAIKLLHLVLQFPSMSADASAAEKRIFIIADRAAALLQRIRK